MRRRAVAAETCTASASAVSGTGKLTRMDNVTWYRRDATGMVLEQIRAPHATFANPGWRLDQPVSFDVRGTRRVELQPTILAQRITPAQVAMSKVDPDGENFVELYQSIQALKAQGRRTSELEGKWWHKISGPLSAMLMPLLGAVAGFGLARSGGLFMRAVIGMALGFAYFVVENLGLAMGSFGGYPPLLAAWGPFVLFAAQHEAEVVRHRLKRPEFDAAPAPADRVGVEPQHPPKGHQVPPEK